MATQPAPSTAQILERCAGELHAAAFDFAEPARPHHRTDLLIDEVERICAEARAAVRGR